MLKKDLIIFRNNLSLLVGLFAIFFVNYFIDHVRNQYFTILSIMILIPTLFHTLSFKRFKVFGNEKYFSTLFISSKLLLPLLYLFTIISMYDVSQFYANNVPIQLALRNGISYSHFPNVYLLTLFFSISLISIYINEKLVLFKKIINLISIVIAILFCFFVAYHIVIHELHRYNENHLNLGIVFNPIVQVFNGASVLIDTKSQYGLYPHFFEPILHLTGISITSISSIMAVFFLVTIGSWYFFLLQTTQNSYLSLIGLIAATFMLSYGSTWPSEIYYQYFPVRTLFPAIFLLIFSFYYDHRSWYRRIIFSSILSLGVLWNFESGAVAFLCFIVLDIYLQYDINKKFIFNIYLILKNIVFSFLSLFIVFLIFFTYIKIRSGIFPTIEDFFYYQLLFGNTVIGGGGSPFHAHMIVMALIYFLGISYGIGALFSGYKDKLNSGIFIISIFGMGTSVYYFLKGYHMGHEALALYPLIILITLFSGRLLISIKSSNYLNRKQFKNNFLSFLYLFLSVSFLSFISSLFISSYKYDVNFTTTPLFHEIIFPSAKNTKALGTIKLDNFDSSQSDFDYVRISDLPFDHYLQGIDYNGNPNQKIPKWIKKYNVVKKYRDKDGNIRDDILIISNYDYFLYLKLNAKAPVKIANVNHIWGIVEYNYMHESIKNNKNIRYVIFDNEELVNPLNPIIYEMIDTVKDNFSLIESFDLGYTWFYYPNKFSVKAADFDISHELKNGDPGWQNNVIQVFKRIE
ncbi:hypothetical protein [Candidatus Pseudothioglobus sp. Uisw_086]|uniref:hypothetical protein n=1 Tax=Candidatus Pseudothioglobus sp. Uisw_086 TaxID=3230998 RepID=UPI003A8A2FDB